MESAIYEGTVRHRRFRPVENAFEYQLFMMYLDLSELDRVFQGRWFWSVDRWNLAWLRRGDHLGDPGQSLDAAIRSLVHRETGKRTGGPVRMLTHLRYFGHCFNPVSFFYCFDDAGQRVEVVVAEINNTPWRQRHCYVLGEDRNEGADPWKRYRFKKAFHVSPFMDMDLDYDWRFLQPGDRIQVHMRNLEQETSLFDATLSLRRIPLTGRSMARVLLRYPAMTVQVIAKIYWQALRLRLKGAPFFTHPSKRGPVGRRNP